VQFGGTVDTHGGTYTEVVTVTRSLTLTHGPTLNGSLTLGDGDGSASWRGNDRLVLATDLDLNGDLTLNGATLDAGAGGHTLDLSGDWTNLGGTFEAQTGTVRFDGAGVQTLDGPLDFYDVAVGQGVSLTTASPVTVGGTLTNQGWTVETRAIDGPGAQAFGLANVTVDVTAQGSLSSLTVARRDQDHPAATALVQTGRYWRITPLGGGYVVDLTLPHTLAAPVVCRYGGDNTWSCAADHYDAATVKRAGITAMSDWAVGYATPYRAYLPLLIKVGP
jgi:hypothetical protein